MILRISGYNWCIFTLFRLTFVGVISWALYFFPICLTFCKQQQINYSGSQLISWSMVKTSSQEDVQMLHAGPVDCSVFSFLLCPPPPPPEMNDGNRPAPELVMVFWFHFPISSLSHFDKVTNRCHLQHPTPFTQAHPNAIINMKYSAQTEENISVYCSEIKPGLRCQLLSASSWAKNEISPPGTANPPLVCTAAAIQQNKIIPVAA